MESKYSKKVLQDSVLLNDKKVDSVIEAVLSYLEKTGVQFEKGTYALDLFKKAGCSVDEDGFVKIPGKILKEYLSYCPERFKWWNRDGSNYVEYGGDNSLFISDCKATSYIEPETGEKKESSQKGLAELVQLVDKLNEFDVCGVPVSTDDFAYDNATVMMNTSKPVFLTSGETTGILEKTLECALNFRDSLDDFKEKPFFATIVSPLVLYYPSFVCDNIKFCAENNIPLFMASMPIGGMSSPVTIAGTLVTCLATTLPGIMLAQMLRKGHPCNETSFPTFMDPATGNVGGYPENSMADIVRVHVCRRLGLPLSQQTALVAGSKNFRQDAVIEIAVDFEKLQAYSFDAFWGAGTLEAGMVFSPLALLYINELISLTRRAWKGVTLDENDFALDIIENVKNGLYAAEDHTAMNLRKTLWRGKFSAVKGIETSEDMCDRLLSSLQKLLERDNLSVVDAETEEKILKILGK